MANGNSCMCLESFQTLTKKHALSILLQFLGEFTDRRTEFVMPLLHGALQLQDRTHQVPSLEVLHEIGRHAHHTLHYGADCQSSDDTPIAPTPCRKNKDAQLSCKQIIVDPGIWKFQLAEILVSRLTGAQKSSVQGVWGYGAGTFLI